MELKEYWTLKYSTIKNLWQGTRIYLAVDVDKYVDEWRESEAIAIHERDDAEKRAQKAEAEIERLKELLNNYKNDPTPRLAVEEAAWDAERQLKRAEKAEDSRDAFRDARNKDRERMIAAERKLAKVKRSLRNIKNASGLSAEGLQEWAAHDLAEIEGEDEIDEEGRKILNELSAEGELEGEFDSQAERL